MRVSRTTMRLARPQAMPGWMTARGGSRRSEPAKSQAAHNTSLSVDQARFPRVQLLLNERVGPFWKGIRQLMLLPLRGRCELDYGMASESVTLLTVFMGSLSSAFFDPRWTGTLFGLSSAHGWSGNGDGARFKLTTLALAPWPESLSLAERRRDCEHLYHLVRCAHNHSFSMLDTDHGPSHIWVTRAASGRAPIIVIHKPACASLRLARLEQRAESPEFRVRALRDDVTGTRRHLTVLRLYLMVYAMVRRLMGNTEALERTERDMVRGKWRG